MRFFNFLNIKFLNNNIVILLAFGVILFMATDLRIYNLTKVYTEYDDIGVLTFHKGNSGTREGNYDYTVLKKTISFSWETLRNLENSYLFPLCSRPTCWNIYWYASWISTILWKIITISMWW